ncbi:MAG: zf-HC2 domain-containing protein, partial [Gemmatimonadota bacterium]|nr:zf-HC2 domain-containing protein [Gemmatimonadota bacterium]
MSHLDDGIIAELIDGELDAAARAAAAAHLAACAECRARHAEALASAGESDRLIAAVGLPRPLRPLRSPPAPARGSVPWRIPWRALGWAASVMLAVGIGYYARVPGPGSPGGVTDSPALLNQQGAAAEGGATLAAESAASLHQDARLPAQPAVSATARAEARQQVTDMSERRPAADAPPGAAAVQERDHLLPPLAGVSAPKLEKSGRVASAELEAAAAPPAEPLKTDAASAATVITLEQAVTRLGGSIRLIDGMTPLVVRLIATPGVTAAAQTVRVVYLDPPARELWLEQRRIDT